jgi:acylphosphatase
MRAARRLVVRGRVQGVNFRAFVAQRARSRGVGGWASNEQDGSVAVWLEGEPDAVAEVERALHEGPAHAHVEAVEGIDDDPRGLHDFERR